MTNNQFIESCLQACADWGLIPTSFRQCMTWEEQVLWLSKFIQEKIVPVVNGHTEAIEEIVHWLDNLDLQEEVNTKLEEMADSGELSEIIAQYLGLAGVFAYDTIADLEAAENLEDGSTARVIGNTSAMTGDGAYYKVRTITSGDVIDGVNKVAIEAKPTLVAVRVPDYEVNLLWSETDSLQESIDENSFNRIKLFQNFIYNQSTTKHFQGCCVDNNNVLYQYEETGGQNGNLHTFDLLGRTYQNTIANVPLYHGNSLAYKDGYIYAAATLNGSTAINKIVKYNLSNGTSTELEPFASAFISKTIGICNYGTGLFVCGPTNPDSVQLGAMKFALMSDDENYTEYTLVNPNHRNLTNNTVVEMCASDDKLYVLTDGSDMLFQFLIDDENHTLTLNKVNVLDNLDAMGLETGELEGMTTVPSGYYGKDTFIVTSFMYQNSQADACSLQVYTMCVNSDLPPITNEVTNQYYPRKVNYVYVKKAGGSTLVEDGTSNNPFRTLNRAIEFVNAARAKGITVAEIQMLDSESYVVGNLTNTDFVVNAGDYSPTLYLGNLFACNIVIMANTNINIDKTSTVSNVYLNYQTRMFLGKATALATFYMARNSELNSPNLTINASAQDWLNLMGASKAQLNVISATNITRNVVNNRESSLLLINSGFANKVYTDGGAYKITGA